MTNGEILKKAIAKAEETGWAGPTTDSSEWWHYECIIFDHSFCKAFWGNEKYEDRVSVFSPTYNADLKHEYTLKEFQEQFGKFLLNHLTSQPYYWTSNTSCTGHNLDYDYGFSINKVLVAHSWQWHLSLMVQEEKPLKYLERFLK